MSKKRFIVGFAIFGLTFAFLVWAKKGEKIGFGEKNEFEAGDIVPKGELRAKPGIKEIRPSPEFLFPTPKAKLKQEVRIKLRVKDASSVEFYLRRPESLLPVYIGRASLLEGEIWTFDWDSREFPNGFYHLYAQITNQYGQYLSKEIGIQVYNEMEREIEKEESLEKEIKEFEKEIEERKERMREEEKESKEKIKKEVPEKIEEAKVEEKIEHIVEKTKEGLKTKKKIEKLKKKKEKFEREIKKIEEELGELPENPIPELKKDKEKRLKSHREEKVEFEKKMESFQKGLGEIKKSKKKLKKEVIEKIKPERKMEAKKALDDLEELISKEEKARVEIIKKLTKDSDRDEIPDREEIRLGTDPFNPDSDGDSFFDGVEVTLGFNPQDPSPADKIVYQDPREVEPKEAEIYRVERVKRIVLPTGQQVLKLEGKGLPNSFITIYVFSFPMVLVTKTDGNGHWEYTLDKPLLDGQHTVYVTVTNNNGEIEARSEPFVFVQSSEKLFRIFQSPTAEIVSPTQILQRSFAILVIAAIIFGIGVALALIGLSIKRKRA